MPSFYRWRHWGTKRLGNLPRDLPAYGRVWSSTLSVGLESARLLARKAFLPSGQDLAVGVWPGAQRGKCTAEDKVQLCSWDVGVDISYIDEHFISIQVLALEMQR